MGWCDDYFRWLNGLGIPNIAVLVFLIVMFGYVFYLLGRDLFKE